MQSSVKAKLLTQHVARHLSGQEIDVSQLKTSSSKYLMNTVVIAQWAYDRGNIYFVIRLHTVSYCRFHL